MAEQTQSTVTAPPIETVEVHTQVYALKAKFMRVRKKALVQTAVRSGPDEMQTKRAFWNSVPDEVVDAMVTAEPFDMSVRRRDNVFIQDHKTPSNTVHFGGTQNAQAIPSDKAVSEKAR